ncbi:pyrimidine utilization protein C [Xanthobacter aminoxidans]|uniref:pyrimidine utilization protein C n=1 Tax=Xanthobacter aminoxidans TaxID=186280 RepID=UPI002022D038|nr:pyrimidine utilization protein C [Xanthobacter aminoxidans]MCL8385455.1 pyrimidine utilization protein C [Xanthobacter aminoxidans]
MPKQIIIPPGSPPPLAPYSPGTRAGNVVYVSGVLAMASDGTTVGVGDVETQTRHVLFTIKSVVETAGGTMDDIAFNSIFLKSLDDYTAMNRVYAEFFPSSPPARYCIRADLVRPEFLVEIASIAHLS